MWRLRTLAHQGWFGSGDDSLFGGGDDDVADDGDFGDAGIVVACSARIAVDRIGQRREFGSAVSHWNNNWHGI